ncbi:MAG: hypothetical protein EZS26_001025 [Candidatus Ordinivivax streblomastigis]|jgi:hypothetical protein|uniref:Uncharacterized protein n=1 Tax=Candidatus Ordinivivax streblomastigis TaxID=2540710 RepID=A0A5M8P304_9BACT|nr:MAG: hypothetical protein EZS26_001025 [Candidatus Ordinivivax streblomastigis]
MKITLDEFCLQWVKGNQYRTMASRFEKNTFDFATIAGEYSKRFFQTSFIYGGFYGSGSKWKARESKWGKKFTHPVMIDTGTLRNSIKGETHESNFTGHRDNGTKIFRRGAKYYIWTTEVSMPQRGKRGRKRGNGRYAAVHNSDPSKTNFTVNQYSSRKPVQRQFIGFSRKLDDDLKRFIPMIFKGFPL